MPLKPVILVVDDEASIRESLEMFLRERGYVVHSAGNGEEGLALWRKLGPMVVVLDLRLPDISGLEVLRRLSDSERQAKVIMITAFHDMESTIEAMRQGAYDYLHKPLDVDELDQAVARAVRLSEASHQAPALSEGIVGEEPGRHRLIGRTPAMRSIFKTIGLLARNRATVLIEGETGTGKELIARVIHEASHPEDQPLVTVDCTTLVENLLESELFGHERGAFTGAVETKPGRLELAGEGAIFFDEIGDLPPPLQSKLLRFLEYREFTRVGSAKVLRSRARIIAATNHDLEELARKGAFRRDLLFRLKVISVKVPPLRERREDIPEMVRYFVHRIKPGAFHPGQPGGGTGPAGAHGPFLAGQCARAQKPSHQGGAGIRGHGAHGRYGGELPGIIRPGVFGRRAPVLGRGGKEPHTASPGEFGLEHLGRGPGPGHIAAHLAQAHHPPRAGAHYLLTSSILERLFQSLATIFPITRLGRVPKPSVYTRNNRIKSD